MPIYEYRCRKCNNVQYRSTPADSIGACPLCRNGELRRDYSSISFAGVMQEHFNSTVNMPISDMGQFKRELRRAGEEYTRKTGMPTDYQPVDRSEFGSVLGMTDEGLDTTNRKRMAQGQRPIEVPKG